MNKKYLFLIAAVFLLVGSLVWGLNASKNLTRDKQTLIVTTTEPVKPISAWRQYENQEIGVAFEYPAAWGEITTMHETGFCKEDGSYYSAKKLAQLKKDIEGSTDPCLFVALKVGDSILATTETPLHNKYPSPRGAFWGDGNGSFKDDEYIKNYCSMLKDGKCKLIKNANNIPIAFYHGETDTEVEGDLYFLHNSRPLYPGLTLSPVRLPEEYQKDFPQLINSLKFIK